MQDRVIEMIAMGHTPAAICAELSMSQTEVDAIIKAPSNKALIERKRTEVMSSMDDNETVVMNMIKTIIMADLTDFYYPDGHDKAGQPKPYNQIPLSLRQCITEIEYKHDTDKMGLPVVNTKIKTIDKMKAIEMYARKMGLFDPDKNKGGKIKFKIGFE